MNSLTDKGGGRKTAACVCVPTGQGDYRYTTNVSRHANKAVSLQIIEVSPNPRYVSRGVAQSTIDGIKANLGDAEGRYREAVDAIKEVAEKIDELRAKWRLKSSAKKEVRRSN